ncbi:MAG: ComEC/Rec2 family competence protein [Pseudomonadota bacterium]
MHPLIHIAARLVAHTRESFLAESDRWFLWSPVFVGAGVAFYFALPFEPSLGAALFVFSTSVIAHLFARHRSVPVALAAVIAMCLSLGLAASSLRAALVDAPVLQSKWTGVLTGRVTLSELSAKGSLAVTLASVTMQRLAPDMMPAQIRLSVRTKDTELKTGELVRLRASLMPPPDPVEPGGFDYARQIWFKSIGAVGFAFSAPEHLEPPPDDLMTALATLRSAITVHVRDTIGGPEGAVAAALITGEQRAIPDQTVEDLRLAGLTHVLSISGLHMALFGGALFWLARILLAMIPRLALHHPIKKWAAFVALLGTTFYLCISGFGVATNRSYIMIALMFLAVMLDRPAISMRNVALAALIVLLWQPETLLSASFHMSFAAVVALIGFYESPLIQRLATGDTSKDRPVFLIPFAFAFRHITGILLTTTIAGFATAAYAAFHFDRVTLYSMAGNLGALPAVSVLVMPAALIALILMPFGLDGPALWVMGHGVHIMLVVAHEVASWEGADRMIAAAPMSALVAVTFGGLWLALWQTIWRWFGILPILLGLLLWDTRTPPDILIDRDGKLVAVRGPDDKLILSSARPAYTAETWLRRDGDTRTPKEAANGDMKICDALGCVLTIATSASADDTSKPLIIAMPKSLAALTDDCTRADIIVASFGIPRTLRKTCEAGSSNHKTGIIIDRFDLWRNGATSLSSPKGEVDDPENWIKETSRGDRGDRPWVQTGRRTRQPVTDIQQKSEVKTPQATKPDVAAGASMDTDAEDTADAAPP